MSNRVGWAVVAAYAGYVGYQIQRAVRWQLPNYPEVSGSEYATSYHAWLSIVCGCTIYTAMLAFVAAVALLFGRAAVLKFTGAPGWLRPSWSHVSPGP